MEEEGVLSSTLQVLPGGAAEADLHALVEEDPGNFEAWTSLIKETEKATPNNVERIFSLYDAFLSEFPLCYGYWKKYADHKARFCSIDKVFEVYERAVQSATFSVGLWLNYCTFGMLSFEEPADVRRLFERALSFVGKDYLCYLVWDKYIEFEYSQKQWDHLAHTYLRTMKFPTKKLHVYHKSYERLASFCEEEMKYQDSNSTEVSPETNSICETIDANADLDQEIATVIKEDLLGPSINQPIGKFNKFYTAGEYLYQRASLLDSKIKCFENCIRRPYFHIKLLDDDQLKNWHNYLDFVEMQGDFDWCVKLYERCLIPCANYPEFWIRYIEFVESKGGREIAKLALVRATELYLKRVPGIHLFCARFKERIGDISGARAAFLQCDSHLEPDFIENVTRNANMEKRLGNIEGASIIYEKALDLAKEKHNTHLLAILYGQFSHFICMATANLDAARDILIRGIKHLPNSKLLLQKLIHFEMMHGRSINMALLDSIIAEATAPGTGAVQGLSTNDREDISKLFLEFVDSCGSIHEIEKAWDRHRRLFPYQMRPISSFHCSMNAKNVSFNNVRTGCNINLAASPRLVSSFDIHSASTNHDSISNELSMQKNTSALSNRASNVQSKIEKSIDVVKEGLQQEQAIVTVQLDSKSDATVHQIEVHDSVDKGDFSPHVTKMGKCAETSEVYPEDKPQGDSLPLTLETLSIITQEGKTQKNSREDETLPSQTLSLNCQVQDASTIPNENAVHSKFIGNEISRTDSTSIPNSTSTQTKLQEQKFHSGEEFDPSSQKQIQMCSLPEVPEELVHTSDDSVNLNQLKHPMQVEKDNVSNVYAQAQQSPQSQQRQSSHPPQHPTDGMQQVYNQQDHAHVWQNQQVQQVNMAPNPYQAAMSQVYSTGTHVWQGQSVQLPNIASLPLGQQYSQPVSYAQPHTNAVPHPQAHIYTYSYQNNDNASHLQNNQGINAQMWDYYQKQQQILQYQLQQQQLTQQQQLQQQQYCQQPQQVQTQPQQPPLQQNPPQQTQPQENQLTLQQQPPQQSHPLQQQHPTQQQALQQQPHQYHQQQIQMWNYSYYNQAFPQYYDSNSFVQGGAQQAFASQDQVSAQNNCESSVHTDSLPQQHISSTQ